MDALSKCDAAVWEAAKGTLTATQESEIEEKRRIVVVQPRALGTDATRARSRSFAQALERLPVAAQGSCLVGRNGRQSQGTENAGAPGDCRGSDGDVQGGRHVPSRLLEVAVGGGCGHALVTLGHSTPQRQQQCFLPPHIPRLGQHALAFPGAAGHHNATCASIATCGIAEHSSSFHPNYPSRFPRWSSGQGGCGNIKFWCTWFCS